MLKNILQTNIFEDSIKEFGAEFSPCRKYRYALWRIWNKKLPLIMFIGLNPSTADESNDDATITRVISLAKNWGYGGVYMMNCFAYISTKPKDLITNNDNSMNDITLIEIGEKCTDVIFAWGNFKVVKQFGRDEMMIKLFPEAKALVINKNGSPRHPLYVPGNTTPVKYQIKA
jgi:hypothetical protein